jgi:hypothetical protein
MKKLSLDEMKAVRGGTASWWEKTKCAIGAGIIGGIIVAVGPLAGPLTPAEQQYRDCVASYN